MLCHCQGQGNDTCSEKLYRLGAFLLTCMRFCRSLGSELSRSTLSLTLPPSGLLAGQRTATQVLRGLTTALLEQAVRLAESWSRHTTVLASLLASTCLESTPRLWRPSGSTRLGLAQGSTWVISFGCPGMLSLSYSANPALLSLCRALLQGLPVRQDPVYYQHAASAHTHRMKKISKGLILP